MTCFNKSQRTSLDMFEVKKFLGLLHQSSARSLGTLLQRHVDDFKSNSRQSPIQSTFKVRILLITTPHVNRFNIFSQQGWTSNTVYRCKFNYLHLWHSVADKSCQHIVPCPDDIWQDGKGRPANIAIKTTHSTYRLWLVTKICRDQLYCSPGSMVWQRAAWTRYPKTHKVYVVLLCQNNLWLYCTGNTKTSCK